MNPDDLRLLAARATTVESSPEELRRDVHARIGSMRRRRQVVAVVATVVAVVLALTAGTAVLRITETAPPPAKPPAPDAHARTPERRTRRRRRGRQVPMPRATIHWGDRTVIDVGRQGLAVTATTTAPSSCVRRARRFRAGRCSDALAHRRRPDHPHRHRTRSGASSSTGRSGIRRPGSNVSRTTHGSGDDLYRRTVSSTTPTNGGRWPDSGQPTAGPRRRSYEDYVYWTPELNGQALVRWTYSDVLRACRPLSDRRCGSTPRPGPDRGPVGGVLSRTGAAGRASSWSSGQCRATRPSTPRRPTSSARAIAFGGDGTGATYVVRDARTGGRCRAAARGLRPGGGQLRLPRGSTTHGRPVWSADDATGLLVPPATSVSCRCRPGVGPASAVARGER